MKSLIATMVFFFVFELGYGQVEKLTQLDSFFTVLEENNRFLGSVAVSRGGEIIYTRALGYSDWENKVANDNETKFRIGSITKTLTAVLMMKAVETGKIHLDDPIYAYFPQIKNANTITVRHLLNHRSGIHNFTDDEDYLTWSTQAITAASLLDTIVNKGVDFEPDTDFSYSNSNYVLLTFILETIFDQPYEQLLRQYITEPLALEYTGLGEKIVPHHNEAQSYEMKDQWIRHTETHMSVPLGAGAVVSTPSDLCRFAEALFSGNLISRESLDQMKPMGEDGYGFALFGFPFYDKKGWGHTGGIDAFTSVLIYFEDDDLCFALTSNGTNYNNNDITIAVLSEVYGRSYDVPEFREIKLSSGELDKYLGVYTSEQLPIDLTISKEGHILVGQGTGQPSFPLTAGENHVFTNMKIGLKLTFDPDKGRLTLYQGGSKFEMRKRE